MNRGNGYDGYSRSNNAVNAEEEGRYPASKAAKILGITTDTLKHFFETDHMEWHHVSKHYNKVKFYDVSEIEKEITQEVLDFDKEVRRKKRENKPVKLSGCEVEWIEWVGTGRNKRKVEHKEQGCKIEISGQKHVITTKSGHTFTKMLGANGFSYKTKEQLKSEADAIKQRKQRQKQATTKLNTDLKAMLSDKSKQLVVVDYRNYVRNSDTNKIEALRIDEQDQEFEKLTQKAFKEKLQQSGLDYAQRTVGECIKNGYSRLGVSLLVIHSEEPQSVLQELKQNRVDSLLEIGKREGLDELKEYIDIDILSEHIKHRKDDLAMSIKDKINEEQMQSFINKNHSKQEQENVEVVKQSRRNKNRLR